MPSKSPWFRCFPDSFLVGTSALGDELFTAYTRLFMMMYSTGRPLPLDGQFLKHQLGKRPQDCLRIVAALVQLGKLSVEDGLIHNKRTAYELKRQGKWQGDDPANDNDMPGDMNGKMNGKWRGHRAKKASKSYARAGDRMRADTDEEEDEVKGDGAPPITSADVALQVSQALGALPPREEPSTEITEVEAAALRAALAEVAAPAKPSQALLRTKIVKGSLSDIANRWKEEP